MYSVAVECRIQMQMSRAQSTLRSAGSQERLRLVWRERTAVRRREAERW